ncbi:hypothetical protein K8089_10125 [Aequorivita sp. F47161]|uniref:Uncharacterized protein n=1 Tax=Aequorivita vitellina TaxID=2874475 RepID=A0A9X1QV92_9FLAO|nr:hypothetical protein [Aequorivita vitellina]MCG2419380.1 hypothetical protein [Aequorivita vitellina]
MAILLCAVALFLVFLLMRNQELKVVSDNQHKKEIEKLEILRRQPILSENYSIAKSVCNRLGKIYRKGSDFENEGDFKFHIIQDTSNYILAKGIIARLKRLEVRFVFSHEESVIKLNLDISNTVDNKIIIKTEQSFYQKSDDFIVDFVTSFVENNTKK